MAHGVLCAATSLGALEEESGRTGSSAQIASLVPADSRTQQCVMDLASMIPAWSVQTAVQGSTKNLPGTMLSKG